MRSVLLVAAAAVTMTACVDTPRVTGIDMIATPPASIDCGPEIQCDDEGPSTSTPYGIAIPGSSDSYCRNGVYNTPADLDFNEIRDSCELALAQAFAPMMIQSSSPLVGFHSGIGMIGGEYLWAIAVVGNATRIAYLPAYYTDRGFGASGAFGHSGDSEYIFVDVYYNATTARYYAHEIFLSAHCGSYYEPGCRWYPWTAFRFVHGVQQGAPEIWVADGKNASYSSFENCMAGSGGDVCDIGDRSFKRFPVEQAFKIDSRSRTLRARRAVAPWVDPNAVEDVYTHGAPFHGWQSNHWGATPSNYGTILRNNGVFPPLGGPVWPPECTMSSPATPAGGAKSVRPRPSGPRKPASGRTANIIEYC